MFSLHPGKEGGERFGGGVGSIDFAKKAVGDPHPKNTKVVWEPRVMEGYGVWSSGGYFETCIWLITLYV